MADEVERPAYGNLPNFALGAYATPTPVQPSRTFTEALTDTALDVGIAGVGALRGIAGVGDAVQTAIETGPPTGQRRRMDSLADLESYLKGSRSDSAKYLDEHGGPDFTREPGTYAAHVATGIAPYAPLAAMGPWGAVPMGAITYGQGRSDIRETIRQAKPEQLMESPHIKEMLARGMSLEQAREQLYTDAVDPTKMENILNALPAVAGNMLGFGAGMAATKSLMRGATGTMVDRIIAKTTGGGALKATGIGVAEGAGAGFAQGTGTEFTRQANERTAGLRPDIDYGEVAHAGLEPSMLFAGLSGAGRGMSRLNTLRKERAALAPPIGTDIEHAATQEAQADQPGWQPPGDQPPPPPGFTGTGKKIKETPAGLERGADLTELPAEMPGQPPIDFPEGPPVEPPVGPARPMPREPQVIDVPPEGGWPGGRRPEPAPPKPEPRPFEFPEMEPFDPRGGSFPHEPDAPVRERPFEMQPEPPERGWASYLDMPLRRGEEGPAAEPTFPQPPGGNQRLAAAAARRERTETAWNERKRARAERATEEAPGMAGIGGRAALERVKRTKKDRAEAEAAEQRGRERGGATAADEAADLAHEQGLQPEGPNVVPFEKPGRPEPGKVEPKIDWRDRDRIEKAMVTKDATTRNGWANRLQRALDAGRDPAISDLPMLGQRMLAPIRTHLDRMMVEHPQGTIDAIRGRHTEPVPDQAMSAQHKTAITELKNSLTDAELNNLNAFTKQLLDGGLKRIVWNRLPSSTRKVLDDLPKETRAAVVDAYTKHAFETVEYTHGKERKEQPLEYRYKGDETPERRAEKLDLDEREAAGPAKEPAAEAPVREERREQTTEEALGSIRPEDFPQEQKTRDLEEVLGLKQPLKGESLMLPAYQNMRRTAIRRIDEGGPWFDALPPEEQQALRLFKEKLEKNPNANISPIPELRRYMHMANNATALARTLNRIDREQMAKKKAEDKRGLKRTQIEASTREKVVSRALTDPTLSFNTLANAYTRDPVTGKEVKTTKGITVRQLFERLLDLPTYVKEGTDFLNTPEHMLLTAAERFRDLGQARLDVAEKAMQEVQGSARGQVSWKLPWRRGGKYQWYDALADTNRLTKAIDIALQRKSIPRLKALMTNFYIMEKAIEMGRIDHWDAHVKEQTGVDRTSIQKKRVGLENRVRQLNDWEDLINTTERRFQGGRKPTLNDAEQAAFNAAKKNYNAKEHANRRAELTALQERLDRIDTLSGLDPYTMLKGESAFSHTEANLIEALDNAAAIKAGHDMSLDYILRHLVEPNEEQAIQKARDEKRMSANEGKAKGDDVIEKVNPEKITKQITEIDERMDRYKTALDALDAGGKDMKVAEQVKVLHDALGDDNLPKKVTRENVDTLTKEMEDRLIAAEDTQRKLAEDANPDMLGDEYGIKKILDASADLSIRTNLPKGAYVRPVSHFLDRAIKLATSTGEKLVKNKYSIRASDPISPEGKMPVALNADQRAITLQNHMFDIANKVIGDVEVVALTEEQMHLTRQQADLPPDTIAFYNPSTHRIYIPKSVLEGPDRLRVLGHEITHPLMEVALERFPDIAKRLDNIRLELQKAWNEPYSQAGEILGHRSQALDNVHEFLSEFFNDGGLTQRALATIEPVGDPKVTGQRQNVLLRTLKVIRDGLFRLILRDTHKSGLSETIVHSLDIMRGIEAMAERRGTLRPGEGGPRALRAEQVIAKADEVSKGFVAKARHAFTRLDSGNASAIWGHDFAQKARRGEQGMQDVVEGVRVAMAKAFGSAQRILHESGANKIIANIADTVRRSAAAWDNFENYMAAENHAGLSGADPIGAGRNSWVSKTADEHAQYRARHADLQKQWERLPAPMRAIRNSLLDFYQKRHDDMANESVRQLIELRKMVDPKDRATSDALIKFIRDKETVTPAERSLLERKVEGFSFERDRANDTPEYEKFRKQVSEIGGVPHLKKVPGVWYPMMRRGNWVVYATHKMDRLAKPEGGVDMTDGTWEFATPQARKSFMDKMHADAKLKDLKFDKMETVEVEGTERYRVRYNPDQLEFFDGQRQAFERHAKLKSAFTPDEMDLRHVSPKKDFESTYLNAARSDRALNALIRSLEKSEGWKEASPKARSKMLDDLYEGKMRHTMSASARATYLPREYALGARKDVLKDFQEYSTNTSYSLAELRHRNEVNASLKSMDDYVESMKHAGSPGDPQGKFNILRQELQKSIHNAADYVPDPIFGKWYEKALARTLQFSFMDKLASPANWAMNGAELAMSVGPLLAGEHGPRAYAEMYRAAKAIGFDHVIEGFRDAGTVLKAGVGGVPELPDVVARMRDRLKHEPDAKALNLLLDHLEMYAHLERDSSMDVGRIVETSTNTALRVMDYADNAVRQIGAGIDNNSKVITAIAAYRLATSAGKGGGRTHEAAMKHAERTVHDTIGNYAKYNEAAMFRVPLLGPMMQFKRFAQRMTANYLRMLYQSAWFGDVTPEQRSIARHQLAYSAGTLVAVSGVLGLPVEPIKMVINAFSPMTGFNSDDAENYVRQRAADVLGEDFGEIVTRGIPRYFNVGIGTRLGLDNLWTQGAPGDKADDWLKGLVHTFAGAPGGYALDALSGTGRLADAAGNYARGETSEGNNNLRYGAQLLLPIKIGADTINAAANYFNGPEGRTRYGQAQGYQPTAGEALMGAGGIRSGREQEMGDKRRAMLRAEKKYDDERNRIYAMYAHAGSRAEQMAIWRGVQSNFNPGQPQPLRLSLDDLIKAEARLKDKSKLPEDQVGLTMTAKQRSILPEFRAYRTQ